MISKSSESQYPRHAASTMISVRGVLVLLLVYGTGIQAQPQGLPSESASAPRIEVTPGRIEDRLRVAVSELDMSPARDNEVQVQYAKTMAYDLEFSDYFLPLQGNAQMAAQHEKDRRIRAIDYGAWQKLNAEVLIKAEFEDYGSQGKIRFYAHDVYEQVSLAALEYNLKYDSKQRKIREIRRAIHEFVDKLVKKYDDKGLGGCAGSYIAFENVRRAADSAGNPRTVREIFIMDYDGYNIRQITRDGNLAVSPAWSPDGRKLVYTSYRQGPPDLYVYNLDTGRIRVLAAFPGLNSAADWSPDGNKIAVSLSRDGNPEIYILSSAGTIQRRVTHHRSVETSPTWSPDGSTLYFISDRFGPPQIMGIRATGGQAWTLTRSGHNDDPDISPRGDKIVFTSSRGGGGFNIWSMNLDGSGAMNLTADLQGPCEHPSWAPDGRHIVFGHSGRIIVMDADGSDKRILTSPSRIPGQNSSPAWGP